MTNLTNIFVTAIILSAFLFSTCNSANILFFFGVSTYSHRITVWPLVEELAERGHNVTFFQPKPNKNPHPKVTELNPELNFKFKDFPDFLQLRLNNENRGLYSFVFKIPYIGIHLCETFLNDPKVLNWTKSAQFDLVFIDSLYNDCGLGLAYKFGAKHAIFGTSAPLGWWPDAYGYPAETNWIPELHFSHDLPMAFFGRLASTLATLSFYLQKQYSMFPALEAILKEKLEIPDMPPLSEIESNTSLILMNTHFSEEVARSLPPLVVPVGGMHCTDVVNPLPKAFAKFINDGGERGFIYVSFGSAAKISSAPKELRDVFFNAMKNIKVQFLWKWDGPRPRNIPVNVITEEWMPQQDILGHPKIRGFITHGGLLGIQEAIHHAVPMIAIPIFADQDYNAERLQRTGRGIALEIVGLTQEKLEGAINKLLTDDSYRNKMKELSIRYKDRPQNPLKTAVWWTEYILRYDDDDISLRPLGTSQNWFQRRLLDVWSFILVIVLAVVYLLIWVLKRLCRACMKKNSQPDNKGQGKKSKSKQS